MAHVELSLTEVLAPTVQSPAESGADSFAQWSATVRRAAEPCLLIDLETRVDAVSAAACTLLGLGTPADVVGLPLLKGGLRLLDFTAAKAELTEQEVDKIPPLLALSSGRLTRGLLRVRVGPPGGTDTTVDAISTPVLVHGEVAGSLTFLAEI